MRCLSLDELSNGVTSKNSLLHFSDVHMLKISSTGPQPQPEPLYANWQLLQRLQALLTQLASVGVEVSAAEAAVMTAQRGAAMAKGIMEATHVSECRHGLFQRADSDDIPVALLYLLYARNGA